MSQFWHAHWAEDSFKSTRLQVWEVPRWYPEWPTRHCTTTKFIAHKNGRLFASVKRSKNPWSDFKDTWELPLKIDRKTAESLSKYTENKKPAWNAYKKKRELECSAKCKGKIASTMKKDGLGQKTKEIEKKIENSDDTKEENLKSLEDVFKDKCKLIEACKV